MPANIELSELTNGSIVNDEWVGTGVFDVLMAAVDKNIDIQYRKSRLKGSDYANVYLTAMQTVITQAIQYALNEKLQESQIDKINDDILSSAKQREVMDAQKDKINDDILSAVKQRELIDTQKDKINDDILSSVKQREVMEAQIDKINDDILSDAKQREVMQSQIDKINDGILSGEKQREVMDAQKELYLRQKESFDDNKFQKLFEAQLNYNGIVFQDADAPDVLDVALENRVNDVYNKIIGNDPTLNTAPEA